MRTYVRMDKKPPAPPSATFVDVVFDGPPSHESGRFVEVEDEQGKSISFGEWIDRGDGMWALRIPAANHTFTGRETYTREATAFEAADGAVTVHTDEGDRDEPAIGIFVPRGRIQGLVAACMAALTKENGTW